jgi:ParB family chromosome partitioning protein
MEVVVSSIVEGVNPRRYFDEEEMQELTRSIKANGILQPIAVRQNAEGKYTIMAGHRRFRAAQTLKLDKVPVHLVDGDEDEIALIENSVRADMSPAEECEAAAKILRKMKGDIVEAAIHLGWTEDKLRRRVALSACSQKVRDALAERKIKLGIAELLATVPETENQDKALEKIVANNLSVVEVKHFLAKLTQKLSSAIFDRAECAQCRFNTAVQSSLFSELVADDSFCTNADCFSKKTEEAANLKAEALKENVQTVRVVSLQDTQENFTKLSEQGGHGVGCDQFRSCHSCAKYGAVVWLTPGHEGEVEQDICFDLDCHAQKVAAAHPAPVIAPTTGPDSVETGASPGLDDDGLENASCGENNQDNTGSCCGSSTPAETQFISSAIIEYRRNLWNMVAKKMIAADLEKGRTILLALVINGRSSTTDKYKIESVLKKYDVQSSSFEALCSDIDSKDMALRLSAASAATAFDSLQHSEVQSILHYLRPNLGDFWKMDADYLKLLTKAQIRAVCDELGISEKLESKVFTDKKEALVKAIMESGIDFAGLVPAHLNY